MADKNLHDIKLDELENKKKTPLKNIIILLALLFIILVISMVITKLIFKKNGQAVESNTSQTITPVPAMNGNVNQTANEALNSDIKKDETQNNLSPLLNANTLNLKDKTKEINTVTERNITSALKVPLRTHVVKSAVDKTKELSTHISTPSKPKTYKVPKKHVKPTHLVSRNHDKPKQYKTPVKHSSHKAPVKHVDKRKVTSHTSKKYLDKVVAKKTTHTTHKSKGNSHFRNRLVPGYYIKVGTYKDISTAVKKVKQNKLNYSLIKTKNDKTLVRVLVGPYKSHYTAQKHLATVKHISSGAYITKAK